MPSTWTALMPALVLTATSAAAQTGMVTGTITTAAKSLAPIRVTIDQNVCGNQLPDESVIVDAQGRLANAVVELIGLKRVASLEASVMNERCRFLPRVQVVGLKANIRTGSKDPVLHTTNAQSSNGRTSFHVALPVPGISITRPAGPAGTVRLTCNTHPWMRGWTIVTENAAAVSGADGRFSIDQVPPGTYELRVWHETLKVAPQKIMVVAGKPTEVNIQMK
jgi:hypothetical protein